MLRSRRYNSDENYVDRRYRAGSIIAIVVDVLVIALVARAFFVMAQTISHPIGDFIITITNPLVSPFSNILEPYPVNESIIIVWDVIFALAVYNILATILEMFVRRIGRAKEQKENGTQ